MNNTKYAVIKIGGKQLMITEGYTFEIERQKDLNLDVLLFSEEGNVSIGNPSLEDIEVTATILDEKKGKKIKVNRYKSKSRYRRSKGHRQPLSVVKIEKISKKDSTKAKAESESTPATKESKEKSVKTTKGKKETKSSKKDK